MEKSPDPYYLGPTAGIGCKAVHFWTFSYLRRVIQIVWVRRALRLEGRSIAIFDVKIPGTESTYMTIGGKT